MKDVCTSNTFWSDILYDWAGLHFFEPQNQEEICVQILWFNSNVKSDGRVLKPFNNDVMQTIWTIEDLMINNRFMNYDEMSCKTNNTIGWLQYQCIISAIPNRWKHILKTELNLLSVDRIEIYDILENKKCSQWLYNKLIQGNLHECGKYSRLLSTRYQHEFNGDEYFTCFKNLYKITKVTKLRDFQYRLLLGKIFTNDILSKWGTVPSDMCNLCQMGIQTNQHLFFECPYSKKIWSFIERKLQVQWTRGEIICNNVASPAGHIYNLVALITKQYIFRKKCLDVRPNINELIKEIRFTYIIELYMAKVECKVKKCEGKWNSIAHAFFW